MLRVWHTLKRMVCSQVVCAVCEYECPQPCDHASTVWLRMNCGRGFSPSPLTPQSPHSDVCGTLLLPGWKELLILSDFLPSVDKTEASCHWLEAVSISRSQTCSEIFLAGKMTRSPPAETLTELPGQQRMIMKDVKLNKFFINTAFWKSQHPVWSSFSSW